MRHLSAALRERHAGDDDVLRLCDAVDGLLARLAEVEAERDGAREAARRLSDELNDALADGGWGDGIWP